MNIQTIIVLIILIAIVVLAVRSIRKDKASGGSCGGNPVVVQNIQEAVMALFQVDAHRIRIMKMK